MHQPKRSIPHILFVFLDGVGLGAPDPSLNPFAQLDLDAFRTLAGRQAWTRNLQSISTDHLVVRPIDATLSVEGLPQSGTGQATLFTGINCAAVAGRHFGPYPHSKTKPVIAAKNIFRQIDPLPLGYQTPSAFANAYPEPFFVSASKKKRWTVTTLSCIEAGVAIRTREDLERGMALAADLTGTGWINHLGYDLEPIHESEAARRLAGISQAHAFTLFEYYLTDKAGHAQSTEFCRDILLSLDTFFASLLDSLDFESATLIVTSDHGNIEDLSTKSHTLNAVPFAAMGPLAPFFSHVESLEDITPAIVRAFRHQLETSP